MFGTKMTRLVQNSMRKSGRVLSHLHESWLQEPPIVEPFLVHHEPVYVVVQYLHLTAVFRVEDVRLVVVVRVFAH